MQSVRELERRASPAPKPQALGFDGATLWMGSRETRRLYALDPQTWKSDDRGEAPGTPWGLTALALGDLRVVCGEGTNDDRVIRSYSAQSGFDPSFALGCPSNAGSHLSYDGRRLMLSQWYNRRMLSITGDTQYQRIIDVPHQIVGQVWVADSYYLVTTDDETSGVYYLTRVRVEDDRANSEDVARIEFDARALAYDGRRFWTNHREADQIVAFTFEGMP